MSIRELRQDHWIYWQSYKKLIILPFGFCLLIFFDFVCGMYVGWYVIGASLNVITESFGSLQALMFTVILQL